MSLQPRFEEVEDDVDPEELELPEFGGSSPTASSSAFLSSNDFPQSSTGGMPPSSNTAFKPHMISQAELQQFQNWSCIYPIYFDVSRSLQEGRKVPLKSAVKNPMAKDLAEACASLGIQSVFEPNKTHPNDWANPGRIRVCYRLESGKKATRFANKQALYAAIAEYLQAHPATKESTLKVQIPGLRADKVPPPPAVPKGWKLNEILPVYSPALSGGGISDNLMKELMRDEGMLDSAAPKKKGKKR